MQMKASDKCWMRLPGLAPVPFNRNAKSLIAKYKLMGYEECDPPAPTAAPTTASRGPKGRFQKFEE